MATARELLCRGMGLPLNASAAMVAQTVCVDPSASPAYRRFITKNFPDIGAELGVQARQVRQVPHPVKVTVSPQASVEAEDEAFARRWFPEIAAAGRYALPGGLSDPTPISDRPNGTPATNPPTGNVTRPPQGPSSAPPAAYVGPAVPPAGPTVTEIPLGPAPTPTTDQERRARRLGRPFDIAARQGPGQVDFTWT